MCHILIGLLCRLLSDLSCLVFVYEYPSCLLALFVKLMFSEFS